MSFDTSPLYGRGRSESILGAILGTDLRSTTIITKFGRSPRAHQRHIVSFMRPIARAMPNVRRTVSTKVLSVPDASSFTADDAAASIELSLHNLRRQTLDIVLFHSPSRDQLVSSDAPELLNSLVSRCVIGAWGVSCDEPSVARAALDIVGCTVLEFPFSLANQTFVSEGVVSDARQKGIRLLARSPLQGGDLLGRAPTRSGPGACSTSESQAAALLRFALTHSGADSVVTAASRITHLDVIDELQPGNNLHHE